MSDLAHSYLTIPSRFRSGAHPKHPERDGFPLTRWTRFRVQLDTLSGLAEIARVLDLARGFSIGHDPRRFFADLPEGSFALDRIEANPWPMETYALTPLVGALQLIARLSLPGVRLTSRLSWDGPEWLGARGLYAKAFGRILDKTPLTFRSDCP